MKIVHIIPGSGGSFYCGNCLRDSKIIQSIRKLNSDAIVLPMYLPLFSNGKNQEVPVFYGAISIYLKQLYPIFRRFPKCFDRLLDSKPMLKLAARMANSTRATGLEEMTVSMLMGEDGNQHKELERMIDWIENHYNADVIHISNALLLGLAKRIKQRLNIPIVCSLQDEDVWVDVMSDKYRENVWQLIRTKSEDVSLFLSVSNYYTEFMKEKLQISNNKIKTIYPGVDPNDYHYINSSDKPRNIGFLSRLCKENGLDILIDVFIKLKSNKENELTKLLLSGGYTADDKKFIHEQKQKIKKAELEDFVIWIDNFDSEERNSFFSQISVLSVPVRNGEAFGIYLIEAMASGIPIVQPDLGAFPEIINLSKGGLIYDENNSDSLSQALSNILNDIDLLSNLSKKARNASEKHFNIDDSAQKMMDEYIYLSKTSQKS